MKPGIISIRRFRPTRAGNRVLASRETMMGFFEKKQVASLQPRLVLAFSMAIFCFSVIPAANSSGPENRSAPPLGTASSHIYFPDYARPYFTYGAGRAMFGGRLLVVPPNVTVITQPKMLIVNGPEAIPVAQAQLHKQVAVTPAFSVHIGSFLVYSDTEAMASQVAAYGVPTYWKNISANDIPYQQLFAGPFADSEAATQTASLLRNKLGINGIVTPQVPTDCFVSKNTYSSMCCDVVVKHDTRTIGHPSPKTDCRSTR